MLLKYLYIVFLLSLWPFSLVGAQITTDDLLSLTIDEVILLDLEPSSTAISIEGEIPDNAGEPLNEISDNSTWINYSSCVSSSLVTRNISVQVDGTLPSEFDIWLDISAYSGSGEGVFGTSIGSLLLSGISSEIITGIGGCYTGDGTGNGHQLNYRIVFNNYSELYAESYGPLVITYTISE